MAWKCILRCPTKPAMDVWCLRIYICTKTERLLTIHTILHSVNHRDNLMISVIALVVPVAGVTNFSMQVCGDSLVEMIDRVLFSCQLYMQVKWIKRMMNYVAYLPNQRFNWHQRWVAADTTRHWLSLIGSHICCGASTFWGGSQRPRLSLGSLAFVCARLAKLLATTMAKVNNCFPWQSVGKLQKYLIST